MASELLEDWLHRSASFPPSSPSPAPPFNPTSAQQIALSWSRLRLCAQSAAISSDCFASIRSLRNHGRALHITEPQARILLSIFLASSSSSSSSSSSAAAAAAAASEKEKPQGIEEEEEKKKLEGGIKGDAALLLSIWLRRISSSSSSSSSVNLESLLNALKSTHFFGSEAILLLGAMCVAPHIKEDLRRDFQNLIVDICAQHATAIREGFLSYALSGIGYAMVSTKGSSSAVLLLQACFSLWKGTDEEMMDHVGPASLLKNAQESPWFVSKTSFLYDYLLLLHMMEWYGTMVISRYENPLPFHILTEEVSRATTVHQRTSIKCAVIMSASGLLRTLHQHKHSLPSKMELTYSRFVPVLESSITSLVNSTYQSHLPKIKKEMLESKPVYGMQVESFTIMALGNRYLLQCAAMAISRSTRFSPSVSILLCLASTLLRDAFPISDYYTRQMNQNRTTEGLTDYAEGLLFKESGTIFRCLCEQYQLADKDWQLCVEKLFLHYSHMVYKSHRGFIASINDEHFLSPINQPRLNLENDRRALRKIHEAILVSVVLLSSYASKQKVNTDSHIKGMFGAEVLSSLACMEFIRQGKIPEYSDLVQKCVTWVSASEATCVMLKSLIPSPEDVVSAPVPLARYKWTEDIIQDARVLFGFRVLATCLDTFPVSCFLNDIAPTMFLYIKHPNQIIAQASHTLLVSFFCSNSGGKDNSLENQRNSVKEQVAVHFIERSFEEFPSTFHYDAFVSVMGAIARQLPPGSSATMVCVSNIARRTSDLFGSGSSGVGADQSKESILEVAKKLQTLLMHLILTVDIQVLSHLLKEVARFVLRLQEPHRTKALEEAFDTLAGSNDLTRKHILVPWLQSLSFLCSNPESKQTSKRGKSRSNEVSRDGVIALNPSSAHVDEGSRSRL